MNTAAHGVAVFNFIILQSYFIIALIMSDFETRFGGIARLYGKSGLEKLRAAHVCIVGIGGVGTWSAEALARSGVGAPKYVNNYGRTFNFPLTDRQWAWISCFQQNHRSSRNRMARCAKTAPRARKAPGSTATAALDLQRS